MHRAKILSFLFFQKASLKLNWIDKLSQGCNLICRSCKVCQCWYWGCAPSMLLVIKLFCLQKINLLYFIWWNLFNKGKNLPLLIILYFMALTILDNPLLLIFGSIHRILYNFRSIIPRKLIRFLFKRCIIGVFIKRLLCITECPSNCWVWFDDGFL